MSKNDYIDIENPALREHMMETLGALAVLDWSLDAVMEIVKVSLVRSEIVPKGETVDTPVDLARVIVNVDPDDFNEEQRTAFDIVRGALMPLAKQLIRQHEDWQQDLYARTIAEHPEIDDHPAFIPSKIMLNNGTHVLRVFTESVADAEAASKLIRAADEADTRVAQ